MRSVLTLLAASSALGAVAIAQADMFSVSRNQQLQLGQRVAKDIRKKEKVLPANDVRVQTLRRVAQRLLSTLDAKAEPWEYSFDVVDSKELNAFALPGGPVFFFTGILDKFETEDQLAGVLAHEITHVRKEHWARSYAASQRRNVGLSIALILLNANRNVVDLVGITNELVVELPNSRKNESEADEGGIKMMADAGYNPNGLADVFRMLSKQKGGGRTPEFLSTHPADNRRVADIEKKVAALKRTFPDQRPLPFGPKGTAGEATLAYLRGRAWCWHDH